MAMLCPGAAQVELRAGLSFERSRLPAVPKPAAEFRIRWAIVAFCGMHGCKVGRSWLASSSSHQMPRPPSALAERGKRSNRCPANIGADRSSHPFHPGPARGSLRRHRGRARIRCEGHPLTAEAAEARLPGRNPDYLADVIVSGWEEQRLPSASLLAADAILEEREPELHTYRMLRNDHGAYEPLDNALSVLRHLELIAIRRLGRFADDHVRRPVRGSVNLTGVAKVDPHVPMIG
jgi:hypothetical protein